MEPYIPFYTLVKFVDAEDITNEKGRTLDLPLEVNNVSLKLESLSLSAETYDPNSQIMFTETTDPNIRCKFHFQQYWNCCQKSNRSVSKCFGKQREDEKKNGIPFLVGNLLSNSLIKVLQHSRIKYNQMNNLHPVL